MLRVDIEIHTCKSQEDHLGNFPFPPAADVLAGPDSVLKDVLQTRVLNIAEYASSAHSTGCEHECACGTDANLATAACTGTATNTTATPDCAAVLPSAGSCPEGCTLSSPAWLSGTADCFSFGDSWDQTTHCCACRANSMTCTEGDNCEDPHARSALPLCADSHARSASAGAQDGNYTAEPDADGSLPGFWPEFTDSLVEEFKNFYGSGRGSVSFLSPLDQRV